MIEASQFSGPSTGEGTLSAEEYVQRGWIHYVGKDFTAAAQDFRQAIRLDGHLIDGHYGLGITLRSLGETTEAVAELKDAMQLTRDETIMVDSARRTILRQLINTQISILTGKSEEEG